VHIDHFDEVSQLDEIKILNQALDVVFKADGSTTWDKPLSMKTHTAELIEEH